MSPTAFDAVIACILLFTTIRGAAKGLVWQLAWIAAILLCFVFSERASIGIAGLLPIEAPLNRWVAMFILYLIAAFIAFAGAAKLHDWIEKAKFKEFDKHLGAVFGFLKGAVFCLVLIFFGVTLSATLRDTALLSHSGRIAIIVMDNLQPILPGDLEKVLHPYVKGFNGTAESTPDPGTGPDPKTEPKQPAPAAASRKPNAEAPETAAAKRRKLIERIAAVYSALPLSREAFIKESESRLSGLADDLALKVLRDWDADVRSAAPDPEPATNSLTKLAERIRLHRDRSRVGAKTGSDSGQR